jgi:uracil-DNA glycosylase
MDPKIFKQQLLDKLYEPYRKCTQCPLGFLGRTNVVFGEGNPNADLMFIGEAPGKDEDEQGRPFVGRSGKLLTKALSLVGINRPDVFITNIVKCRPPNNRTPLPVEITICTTLFLVNQIKIIRPKVICTLGTIATNSLMGQVYQITKVRGSKFEMDGIVVIPTYHPSYILRNQSQASIWLKDIKSVKDLLDKS